ncbi:UNVERIFIED_ORG: hemolysin-activating ACP:hemolysin acyltransferase [Methylobacterium sp. SuP10 SLI 274]|uniref:toxin-activating lysine-acyltransferase n=1 Tax=Methylorubrum extorquens TaxID=408 RepID=UPI0020A04F60|nr:toxin-activating lysine-acyltransferase [Methylorubrum extorquens]MDF9866404.1 hemolysin-activating ACP:hemolysin acyltransferase [Methylorubrum pseudosasae]MDH6640150.1 hemolysin-activating ACP:hemolysin acyltransferase [Methylobacterium sp. SuP10 SLI 274]MDH6669341.1 hemolysin-activating ACP:hemolysin acyltransferase [Methylorubrum zatmanii]MCP1561899.1 cytolysin-activating lysine-acyltransferase [Methylorubrum extorquens]MDF9794695.1 hemolysin-activating ACP:hemolysin acyltransferase [Me
MAEHDIQSSVLSKTDKTIAAVFGEIVWLMSRSAEHRLVPVGDLEHMVMPPLLLRQMRLFYDGDQPAAAVLYARLSETIAARLDAGTTTAELTAEDWQSGESLRMMLVIAPFGGGEIYAQETLGVLGGATRAPL